VPVCACVLCMHLVTALPAEIYDSNSNTCARTDILGIRTMVDADAGDSSGAKME
jgi:hypothetical protein